MHRLCFCVCVFDATGFQRPRQWKDWPQSIVLPWKRNAVMPSSVFSENVQFWASCQFGNRNNTEASAERQNPLVQEDVGICVTSWYTKIDVWIRELTLKSSFALNINYEITQFPFRLEPSRMSLSKQFAYSLVMSWYNVQATSWTTGKSKFDSRQVKENSLPSAASWSTMWPFQSSVWWLLMVLS